MSEEHQNSSCYQVVRGLLIPDTKLFKRKYFEVAMDYMPGDDDLIVASYPKTGSTWMRYICLQIKSKGQHFPSFDDAKFKIAPTIELNGVAAINAQAKPRFYKQHIPYDKVQKNSNSKTIYTYRHPEDTLVSFYHFIKDEPEFRLDFYQFVDAFVTGHVPYGSCFKHVLSFYKHREDANLLMVSYEKLHANTKEEVLRIAKFIGEEYYECLIEDEQLFDKILEHTSFDCMKNNLVLTNPDIRATTKENPSVGGCGTPARYYFRKGIVGDGKAVLPEDQRQRCKAAAEEVLKDTFILDEWYSK